MKIFYNPVATAATGFDALTHRSVTTVQAYEDFAVSTVGLFSGEVADAALGYAGKMLPSLGRSWAGFFGRGVSDSITREFNGAIDSGLNTTSHPLQGWTPQQVIDHVNQLGLKTPRDQLILWSGLGRGNAGIRLSQEYARENGGITLEMTAGGKWLDQMDLFSSNSPFKPQVATEIWGNTSRALVQQAGGQVRTLLGQVRPNSIYISEEMLELHSNSAVLGIEEVYLKPKFTFL